MGGWEDTLRRVEELNKAEKAADAQSLLTKAIREWTAEERLELANELELAIATFYPKRQLKLRKVLQERGREPATEASPNPAEPTLDASVERICLLNRTARPSEAEQEFRALLRSLPQEEIKGGSEKLDTAVASFLRKRQRVAAELLAAATAPAPDSSSPMEIRKPLQARFEAGQPGAIVPRRPVPTPPKPNEITLPTVRPPTVGPVNGVTQRVPLTYSKKRLSEDLDNLGTRHIFQWATFYRDTLSEYFDDFLIEIGSTDKPAPWLNLMKASLSHHATAIFQRGYHYQLEHNSGRTHYAVTKSLAGVQRFLDLPLEFYSARLAEAHQGNTARHLRQLCSAMASGILIGYSNAKLEQFGRSILPRYSGSWVHVLPFLTADDLKELMGNLTPGVLVDGIHDAVLPFVSALDSLLVMDVDGAPLPALSQYSDRNRRLEVSLQLPPKSMGSRRVEVLCYLEERHVDRLLIEEAAGRAVGAVIAPLRADLRVELLGAERLSDIVVPTGGGGQEPQTRLVALLENLVDETTATSSNRPIDFNYAAYFPLHSPFLTRYSHVYRTSVRRLLQSFERRNGARLWCSVRRSGKTTACASDLGSTSAQSVVVAQTCDSTGQAPDEGVFYGKIQEALQQRQRLDSEFVNRTVAECLLAPSDARIVLVLDEYETLFGALRTAMDRDPGLRYDVVQPLLNQLVAFTRDNLLIFVGQRPDAHWILTDQNQLSPVVIQDAFPLFAHDSSYGSVSEFHELVQKMMSGHVAMEPGFVDQVFTETGGHPFLTGKLLVSFWDWLIANQRPVSCLAPVRPELFTEFTETCLGSKTVAHNHQYEMFRRAAADHLSAVGRANEPWLHSVYTLLRSLVLSSPATFSVSRDEFAELAERTSDLVSPEDLLSTATRANFLILDGDKVRPRIPLLGRIAAAVRPG